MIFIFPRHSSLSFSLRDGDGWWGFDRWIESFFRCEIGNTLQSVLNIYQHSLSERFCPSHGAQMGGVTFGFHHVFDLLHFCRAIGAIKLFNVADSRSHLSTGAAQWDHLGRIQNTSRWPSIALGRIVFLKEAIR